MKILHKDLRKGIVRVRVECIDDLWILKNVIKEGDIVVGKTLRDVKVEGEGKRRLPMVLAIKVKNVYFQPFSNRLRVHGVIIEGPNGYGLKGSHHTLNIDVGSEVDIIKDVWSAAELRRLSMISKVGVKALLIALDFDEISIAILYHQGVRYLISKELPGISSNDPDSLSRVINEAFKYIADVLSKEDIDIVIVGSPAVLREYIANRLKELNPKLRVVTDSVSHGGKSGIEELIRRDSVKLILKEVLSVEIEDILNEFMRYLSKKPERVAYGLNDVLASLRAKAIKYLLVVEDLLSSDERDVIEEIMSEVENYGGKVRIVPKETPTYLRVKSLGGILAILRYDLDFNLRKSLLELKR